jgi:hypothetical protein
MGDGEKRRVIVFFTRPDVGEFVEEWNFNPFFLYAWRADDSDVTQGDDIKFPQEFERLVVWVNSNKLHNEVGRQPGNPEELLDQRAQEIFDHLKEHVGEAQILVAWHRWRKLSITDAMLVQYYHITLPEFEPILLRLIEQEGFAARFDEAWEYLLSAPRLPALKHLSHRIEHIFAPLAIDIQGILQVEPFRRHEYARKIIESYSTRGDHPFLKLLADLCFLLSRSKTLQFQLQPQTVTVKTDLTEEDLPQVRQPDGSYRRMALNEILSVQEDIDCAKRIREICGLDDSWMPKADSWLADFLKKLDAAVAENNPAKLVGLVMSEGKEFLQKCQELHRCFDELEQLLPEYAEP